MPWSIADFLSSFRRPALWLHFAFTDVEVTYKKSLFGLAWISLSLGVFIFVKILVFSTFMSIDDDFYTLWVGIGFWIWLLFVGIINDGSRAFLNSKGWILGSNVPLSTFVLQTVTKGFIRLVFSLPVILFLFFLTGVLPGTTPLGLASATLGFVVYFITGVWVVTLFATICTLARDLMHVLQTFMQVAFFLTPILFVPEQFGENAYLFKFNPFTHYLAIVRDPLVGLDTPLFSWAVVFIVTSVCLPFSLSVFHLFGRRVAFYVS